MSTNQIKHTGTAVCAGQNRGSNSFIQPVWIRIPEAIRLSGMCRSSIYALIAAGRVKSFTNKIQPDYQRGTRLISYASLVAYIEQAYQDAVGEQCVGASAGTELND